MYSSAANFLQKKFNFDAHYFLKGGFWLSLTQVIVVVAGILTTSLLAHYLSETDYGIYRYLIGLAVLFSSFSLTGLGQSILQTAAKKYYGFYKETIMINFIFNVGVFLSALLGAGYYFYKENVLLGVGCLLIAFFQPIINLFQFTPTYLQGSSRFRESSILQGIKTFFISIVSICSLYITSNIIILAAAYFLATALANTLSYLWYRPEKIIPTPLAEYSKYLLYAKHTSLRNVLSNFAFRADNIIIFTQLGAAELAVYTIATVVPEQIKGSFKNLASLLLPKYVVRKDMVMLKNSVFKRSAQLFVVLACITIVFIITIPYLYNFLFPKYTEAIYLSQLLSLSFLTATALIPATLLQAMTANKKLYEFQIFEAVISLTLMISMTFYFGLLGAVFAKVIVRYIAAIYYYYLYYRS